MLLLFAYKLPILVGLYMKKLFTVILASVFVTTLAKAEAVVGNVEAGKTKVAMCIGCHGIPGYRTTFPLPHNVPMISGQTAGYITAALEAYRSGKRQYPTMRGIAVSLTDQDIADVAAFYAQDGGKTDVPATPTVAPSDEVAALFNRDPANNCTTCHGANFNTPNSATVPLLAGQHADYLHMALKSYQKNDAKHFGRDDAVMGTNVKNYTNAELKAMAKYIGKLPGQLKVVGQDFKK